MTERQFKTLLTAGFKDIDISREYNPCFMCYNGMKKDCESVPFKKLCPDKNKGDIFSPYAK